MRARGASSAGSSAFAEAGGYADLQTDTTRANFFQTETTDASVISYDAINREWRLEVAGTYLEFGWLNFATGAAAPAAGARFALDVNASSPGGGSPFRLLNDQHIAREVLSLNGGQKIWNANYSMIRSPDASQVPYRPFFHGSCSDGGSYLTALQVTFVRLSDFGIGGTI